MHPECNHAFLNHLHPDILKRENAVRKKADMYEWLGPELNGHLRHKWIFHGKRHTGSTTPFSHWFAPSLKRVTLPIKYRAFKFARRSGYLIEDLILRYLVGNLRLVVS
jgi:hypothetical protein